MRATPPATDAPRPTPRTIDDYIAGFPLDVQAILAQIRATVHEAVPDAEEKISYRMPAFVSNGVLVYFAAFKKHIGLFPPVRGDAQLEQALAPYTGEKGNLKFPLDRPIPYALIKRVVALRAKQNAAKAPSAKGAR